MQSLFLRLLAAAPLALSSPALFAAVQDTAIPEPGVLELAGLGAAVAIAIAYVRRRK